MQNGIIGVLGYCNPVQKLEIIQAHNRIRLPICNRKTSGFSYFINKRNTFNMVQHFCIQERFPFFF